jgi:hypothetical protein
LKQREAARTIHHLNRRSSREAVTSLLMAVLQMRS